jgi:hypothetical protein
VQRIQINQVQTFRLVRDAQWHVARLVAVHGAALEADLVV